MASNKRNDYQIKIDKQLIIKQLMIGHKSYQDIADMINKRYKSDGIDIKLSRQQIAYDVNKILEELDEDRIKEKHKLIAIQEKRIFNTANEAYNGWLRSQGKKEKTLTRDKSGMMGFTEEVLATEQQYGDPRFLNIINDCHEKINKLHGLYVVEKNIDDDDYDTDDIEVVEPQIPHNGRD